MLLLFFTLSFRGGIVKSGGIILGIYFRGGLICAHPPPLPYRGRAAFYVAFFSVFSVLILAFLFMELYQKKKQGTPLLF